MSNPKSNVVAVALSGGLDSAVAALVLKKQGWDVFGITMQHTESSTKDAERLCKQLDIAHHVIDLKDEFNRRVIETFMQEYLRGRTPNPCVQCNQAIKWGLCFNRALRLGATRFATGHYARIDYDPVKNRFLLLKGCDHHKDQSYALWRLDQDRLSKTLFPIGALHKQNVRELGQAYKLAINKKESQDICFIPDDDYARFLCERLAEKNDNSARPGPILDQDDRVVGQHKGYPFYTIGQRKGLGVAVGRPQYVTEINAQKNSIKIGDKADLLSAGLIAYQPNWVATEKAPVGMRISCHIRYNDPGYGAVISHADDQGVAIRFEQPRPAVTPGQSAVFYQKDRLIGGGIIQTSIKT